MAASGTSIHVTSQSRCAAVLDGAKYFQLRKAEGGLILVEKTAALGAENVGHLHGRPAHFFWRRYS